MYTVEQSCRTARFRAAPPLQSPVCCAACWTVAIVEVDTDAAGDAAAVTALNALKGAISNFADISQQGWVIKWEGETPCGAGGLPWTGVICTKDRVTSL